jgi:FkbH-like protein
MSDLPAYRIAVLGDQSTQLLARAVRGCGYEAGLRFELFDADYDQIETQILRAGSALYEHEPQAVLLALCAERLYEDFCATPPAARRDFAQRAFDRILALWAGISGRCAASVIQPNFLEYDDGVFGSYAGKTELSFLYQVKKLNLMLFDGCRAEKSVFPLDLNGICLRCGLERFRDAKLYYDARMPLSTRVLPAVAKAVTDLCLALTGAVKKCVVTDLDNTLWGGIVGEDGPGGIELGELGRGAAFVALQRFLKELKNRGVLLAVCSKNDEAVAREVFEKHPGMVLKPDDISLFVANWNDKAANLRYIRDTLRIGLDSIVFLDDSPFERELVRAMLPSVTTPELPADPAAYADYLRDLNLFETSAFTEEDRGRTELYRAEAGRARAKEAYASLDDYLRSLGMEAEAKPFGALDCPRIAQLTLRSNRFNLRTGRYTEAELRAMAADERYRTLCFALRDRFGPQGLVGAVILEARGETLFVSEWLMSCRVLGRGMEDFMVNAMFDTARREGFASVEGEYMPTEKNAGVSDLYARMGFAPVGDGRFRASVEGFCQRPCLIARAPKTRPDDPASQIARPSVEKEEF